MHGSIWHAQNLVQNADFVLAVALGVITSAGFVHLFARDASNTISDYPLALPPGFLRT
jgi:hypothetical protein